MIAPHEVTRSVLRDIFLTLLTLAAFSTASPAIGQSAGTELPPTGYILGQGVALGTSGFTLGGYASASVGQSGGDPGSDSGWRGALDSLSALISWNNGGRWSFFSEFELEDSLVVEDHRIASDAYLDVERFYVDFAQSDALNLRIGKFLTPVGRWNQIHAAPLTWTTSRPLITEATFPTNATGAMLHGVLPGLAGAVEYAVYASPGQELRPDPELDTFEEAYGGHLNFSPVRGLDFGVSFVDFEQRRNTDERKKLYSIDFGWRQGRWEVSGEYALRLTDLSLSQRDEQGGYLQIVAPLIDRLHLIARYESFRDSSAQRDLNLYLGGLNYRWRPAIVFKAEYSRATDNEIGVRDGALASVSVLF